MLNPTGPDTPPAQAVARILRLALAASVVLYGVLTMVLRDKIAPMDLPGEVHAIFHGIAGLLVLAGIWLFRRVGPTGPRAPSGEPAPEPTGPRLALPPRMIAGWVLFESVGVVGLVVSLIGGTGQLLVLAALVLILLHPPRREWFS
jgi:hypothetical protein